MFTYRWVQPRECHCKYSNPTSHRYAERSPEADVNHGSVITFDIVCCLYAQGDCANEFPKDRPVVSFETGSLADLVQTLNDTTSPTAYDLCGRELSCPAGTELVRITASNVSLRNGRICLAHPIAAQAGDAPSLFFSGTGVELTEILISEGHIGVWVPPGGGLTMRGCTLAGMQWGMLTGSSDEEASNLPSLVVHDSKVLNCKACSLLVGRNSRVQVTDCLVTNDSGSTAVVVQGSLQATRLRCLANNGVGVRVQASGRAVLTDSTLTGNRHGSVEAGSGSKVVLARCSMDSMAKASHNDCVTFRQLQQVRQAESPCSHKVPATEIRLEQLATG